ncbi:PQQ-binding-like beta-propeller repeat protein [Akkermansiaceae bacterium]|nr:PQQ-binding-like beta-propeller repeat protein [Akkermansiaceae bacterium]MDA7516266.1 PQQ-binding-like beta-propeller repeat protein [bacterium]MDA7654780.1 PQQ-binding-like beta-propeller repeat protein [Akkermansiaceae bacterium]MDB4341141.1 PQQ-binding-like beta-propeller repeat protein [Akkermansiaceae bacterium]MDB4707887.1 PQQ-binding-like beta-propeller repeat protein [Akkermansiaceae bacterium]
MRTFILSIFLLVPILGQKHWPSFRGAESRGISENPDLPDIWSATKNVAWKTDIPGRGWSSPIVWGKRVFLTTVVNRGESESPKKGLYFGGNRLKIPESTHLWKVICLDLESGEILWDKDVHKGKPKSSIHLKNSYASETPVTDGELVYCYFGSLGLYAMDFEGNVIWTHKVPAYPTRYGWGTASSPVLHKDRVYLVNDNDENSYLLALDKKTGKEIWKTSRAEKSNWSNPYVWQNELRTEIVTPGSGRTRSYDLDGKELWTFKGMSSITIATPYAHDNLLYLSSGYVGDSKRPLYAIKPGAEGDISVTSKNTSNDFIAWSNWKAAPYNPSTLLYRDQIYVLLDRGYLSAFDPKTGSLIYGKQRLPGSTGFTASPWAYQGKIFCFNEDGGTNVCRAGTSFELLHTNQLAEDDMGMATPAIAGKNLLIRTSARIYCIRK